MKNLFFLGSLFLSLFIISCEPVEDIENEISNELDNTPVTGVVEYTLVEEDYTDVLNLDFPNFSNTSQAKELVPVFLNDLFPFWGKGSQALVTYDLYSPQLSVDSDPIRYTVMDDEYDPYSRFGNFDNYFDIKDFLSNKYPNASDGDLVLLTFKFYDGSVSTRTEGFIFDGTKWIDPTSVTDEQYAEMGHGRYNNFDNEDQAETKLEILLNSTVVYDAIEEGDVRRILYKYYNRGVNYQVANFSYTNGTWMLLTNISTETLQFGNDGENWVPDNTIKYELEAGDYGIIGNALSNQYPGPASSASRFANFDRREGNSNYWSDEMILEGMNALLDNINPDAEEGQKYEITYATYTGTSGTETIFLIKENGEWVYNTEA